MRHLLAEPAESRIRIRAHLAATAKVQIFAERSKSGRGAEVERSGARENAIMTPKTAACIANCQRAESPTKHKL